MRRRQLLAAGLALTAPGHLHAATPAPAWTLDPIPLGEPLWLLAAQPGDADAANRGQVSHVLMCVQPRAVWLIGSGPSPAFGAALARTIARRWPGRAVELISPWAHPESVLGVQGLRPDRHWSHGEVADQMQQRCDGCLQRLAQRLGAAASDLADGAAPGGPVDIPQHRFSGEEGRIGPWRWWRLQRAADVTVTVWSATGSTLVHAPGLLWGDAPPDGRDADIDMLSISTRRLLERTSGSLVSRWLGQQGGVLGRDAVEQAGRYWAHVQSAALAGQDRGDDGLLPPACPEGVPAAWCSHERHALNWQRAWRQAESRWLQRSLR